MAALGADDGTAPTRLAEERGTLADLLRQAGHAQEALAAYRVALADAETIFGRDHVRTMNTRTLLAQLAIAERDPDAERLQRDVIADLERASGPDGAGVLVARSNLAKLLHALGRDDEAADLYRSVVAQHGARPRPRPPGHDHHDGEPGRPAARRRPAGRGGRDLPPAGPGHGTACSTDHPVTRAARRRSSPDA